MTNFLYVNSIIEVLVKTHQQIFGFRRKSNNPIIQVNEGLAET